MHRLLARTIVIVTAVAFLFAFTPSAAQAAMLGGGGGVAGVSRADSVIVQVRDAAQLAAVRASLQKDGATVTRSFRWNALVVTVPVGSDQSRFATQARAIAGVQYAQGNGEVHALAASPANDPLYPSQWGLPDIGAPAAWGSSEGSGVSVAVIDTGIDATQPDLAGQVVLYKNYVTPGASAADDEGHGTHVSGIIAAVRNNGIEGAGTAPRAKLYAFKVLDSTGSGDEASVAAAIRDAVDLTPCRIISMSLGGQSGASPSTVLGSAVAYAESKGAIVIAAAGNEGVSAAAYPAAFPGVVGVGAVDSTNKLASFSNFGSADLDIVAPGVNIVSTVPGASTASWSGTSMATPFVSGAAALVWSAHPELTATQLASVLENTAKDLGTAGVDSTYGHGLVRPDLALASLAAPTPSPTPTPEPTPTPAPTTTPSPVATSTPPPSPTPPPFVATALTLSMSKSTMARTSSTLLSGALKPGAVHDTIKVYAIRPGAKSWTYWRAAYATTPSGSSARWSCTFKATKAGVYRIRVRFMGASGRLASMSRTLSLRVR